MTQCRTFLAALATLACSAETDNEEVSLLQQHIHFSASASLKTPDTIYHLHIPKTAGLSFGEDALPIVREDNLKLASREGCFAWGVDNPSVSGTAVMLRDPRQHVLSEFDYCHITPQKEFLDSGHRPNTPRLPDDFKTWLQSWVDMLNQGWHGDFTPSADLASLHPIQIAVIKWRMSKWARPPFSAKERVLSYSNWPTLDGGGTIWHFVNVPYQCYVPINLQAQRLTCEQPLNYTAMPSAELATQNMHSSFFVGIFEAYQASLCLFHVKLGHKLPAYCDCTKPALWNSFRSAEINIYGHKTGIDDFPADVIELVDELTVADRKLYKAARVRFLREIAEVEKEHGVRIVCDDAKRQLEA